MEKTLIFSTAVCLFVSSFASADTFGTGTNQFEIEFVTISGDASSTNGTAIGISSGNTKTFTDPGTFRMGQFEITNDQWNRFVNIHGKPTGTWSNAYKQEPYWKAANVPTNNISWLEAAQFVNWLNISTGHHPAYNFVGTPGTSSYNMNNWSVSESWDGTNLYRHKDAFYFIPSENEWVKAAYWNGSYLQEYTTKASEILYQGNGSNGGWNYYDNGDYGPDGPAEGPWVVGSSSQELNGTYDMMGNVMEWMENDLTFMYASAASTRSYRGGSYETYDYLMGISQTSNFGHTWYYETETIGFRVASVPEPATLSLLALGGLALLRKRK
jgi:formylglycine-generating enzyme required for sulfatase activity